jgi:regulatory protein
MDAGRPDGDSSSQSVSRIVQIRIHGAAGEVAQVDLSDGSSFSLPTQKLESEGLAADQTLSPSRLEHLELLGETFEARRKALDLLALREQSKARLSLKLRSRGFGGDAIRIAVDDLERTGALDDLRFAELWISARVRRNPCGRMKLYAGLLGQGLSRSAAEEALRDWSDGDEQSALRRAADQLTSRSGATPERVLRSLVSKGFSYASAKRVLEAKDDAI